MEECDELFVKGQVSSCFAKLTAKLLQEEVCTSLRWTYENNILVCKFLELKQSNDDLSSIINEFESLLQKIQGVPLSQDLLTLEISVVYNYCSIIYFCSFVNEQINSLLHLCCETLRRVTCALNLKADLDDQSDIIKNLMLLMRILTRYLSECQESLVCCIVLLFSVVSVLLLVQKKLEEVVNIIKLLLENIKLLKQSQDRKGCVLAFPFGMTSLKSVKTSTSKVSSQDILYLLLACTYFLQSKFEKCLKELELITTDIWWQTVTHLQAFIHFQLGVFNKAATILRQALQNTLIESHYKAIFYNMLGCILAIEGKFYLSIQFFKDSIQSDSRYFLPLYNMSLQYRHLNLAEAELEALNILFQALNDENEKKERGSNIILNKQQGIVNILMAPPSLSQIEILYTLARRYYELQRVTDSADHYLHLLAVLQDSPVIIVKSEIHCPLPSMQEVLHQSIRALLDCDRQNEALIVCEEAITKYCPNFVHKKLQNDHQIDASPKTLINDFVELQPDCAVKFFIIEKKRKLPPSNKSIHQEVFNLDNDVIALSYKAEALMRLKNLSESWDCLNLILQTLNHVKSSYNSDQKVTGDTLEPLNKKARDNTAQMCQPVTSDLCQDDIKPHLLVQLKAQAYNNKAFICIQKGFSQDALHLLRLSLLCQPDYEEAVYNYVLLLIKLQRIQDGYQVWRHFRGNKISQVEAGSCSGNEKSFLKVDATFGKVTQQQRSLLDSWVVNHRAPS